MSGFINAKVVGSMVNPENYHQQTGERGDARFVMSPSSLKEFARCPSRWRAGYAGKESASKDFGSLIDCGLLTPDDLTKRFVVEPDTYTNEKGETKPWSNNANVCRVWKAQQVGKQIVALDAVDEMEKAVKRVLDDQTLYDWHRVCDKQVHIQGTWQDDASGLFVPVRCLIDYAPKADSEFDECLGDLKTSYSGGLKAFNDAVGQMGYHLQAAFDLALYNAATGESRNKWVFVGIENYPPYEPFRRMLDDLWLELGVQRYTQALRLYCKCLKENNWPNYDDMNQDATQGWSICSPPPWMLYDAESDKMRQHVEEGMSVLEKIEGAGL